MMVRVVVRMIEVAVMMLTRLFKVSGIRSGQSSVIETGAEVKQGLTRRGSLDEVVELTARCIVVNRIGVKTQEQGS